MRRVVAIMVVLFSVVASAGASSGTSVPSPMLLELSDGKIMARIPSSTLGQRVIMASVIEMTSDSGEGAAGRLSDNCVPLIFTLSDRHLVVSRPADISVRDAVAGDWKRYAVKDVLPDGTVVADVTDLFESQTPGLFTFPENSYNSMGGQVRIEHKLVKDKSSFLQAGTEDGMASVLCDFFYEMDGYVMGVMKVAGDYSLRAKVRKMLFFSEEKAPLPKLKTDPRVGVCSVAGLEIGDDFLPVDSKSLVKRWRISPSDSLAWLQGKVVAPERQIAFYVDSLVPEQWKKYVCEGVLVWNDAFRQAGFRDVLKVEDVPASPYSSRIIFVPGAMDEVDVTHLYDSGSGEIFSSQICLSSGLMKKYSMELIRCTAASLPEVRCSDLPDSLSGQLVRTAVMQAVGKALGLTENALASYSYPVDSLRSPSFTAEYGITASVMEQVVFNYIADHQDVRSGARLWNTKPGPYDCFALSWLYGPPAARSEQRMSEAAADPMLRWKPFPSREDPDVARGDLGDDPFFALDRWTSAQKELFANLFDWFAEEDTEFIASLVSSVTDQYARHIVRILQYVGSDRPASVQSRAVKDVVARLRDMEWFRAVPPGKLPYGSNEFIADVYRTNIFNSLLKRHARVSSEISPYGESEFVKDLSETVFTGQLRLEEMMPIEMVWQDAFIRFLGERALSSSACLQGLLRLRPQILDLSRRASGELADHYSYLLFITDRYLDKE